MPHMISSVPCATAQSVAITIFTVYTFIAYVSIDINDKLFMTNLAKIHQFNICKYGKIYKNSDCSNGYSRNDIHIDFVEISQYFYAFRSIIIFMQAKYINMHHNFSFYRQIARVHGTIYKKAVQQLLI